MIKKIILGFGIFASFLLSAQCNITGKSTIGINDVETYTLQNDNAQCTDCHLWVTIGGNSQLEGDFRKSSVKLKPTSAGRTVLSLSVLTGQGLAQCSKNIDIVDSNSAVGNVQQKTNDDCDINVNNFKEVKYSDGIVAFIPSSTNNNFRYTWTVTFANGEQKESEEKVPQFPYNQGNGIVSVKMKIVSGVCLKNFSKTYEASYWKFF
ncbi:MAG: hypothetical protein Q4G16_08380 [Cruoricaptor ignavus]|nr:hypothetical protein [Cruoricaptor ignavus]